MNILAGRRPQLVFLASLLLFCGAVALRWTRSETPVQATAAQSVSVDGLGRRGQPRDAQSQAAKLQQFIKENPGSPAAYSQLGAAYLQLVRETGDPSYYGKAEGVFKEALKLDAQNVEAMTGMGELSLARHTFADALEWGRKALALTPQRAQIMGIIGDALTELGRYDEAVAAVQQMVDTRPDLASYSRVAYMRELHGDTAGAIDAMSRAVEAGGPVAENTAWVTVQLGNLYLNSGDLDRAELEYQRALVGLPNYAYATAGLGRVAAARGEIEQAIGSMQAASQVLPLPEFVIALGDLYERTGQEQQAADQRALVQAMQQLNAASGVDVDMELSLFNVDHDQNLAEALGHARAAYERRPSIYGADALSWALFKNGQLDEARALSDAALGLGTRDGLLHYHAGRIAEAQGASAVAQGHYEQALAINPHFSIRYSQDAQERLARLQAQ